MRTYKTHFEHPTSRKLYKTDEFFPIGRPLCHGTVRWTEQVITDKKEEVTCLKCLKKLT